MKKFLLLLCVGLIFSQISLLQVAAAETNIALGKSIYSNYDQHGADNRLNNWKLITDGVTDEVTPWGHGWDIANASNFSNWFVMDLEAQYDITKIVFYFSSISDVKFSIEGSADGSEFTLLRNSTLAGYFDRGSAIASFSEAKRVRFIRFTVDTYYSFFLKEFKVYSESSAINGSEKTNYTSNLSESAISLSSGELASGNLAYLVDGKKDVRSDTVQINQTEEVSLLFDLGSDKDISSVNLFMKYYQDMQAKVETSTDGIHYSVICGYPGVRSAPFYTVTSQNSSWFEGAVYPIVFDTVTVRYVKITIQSTMPDLSEIEIISGIPNLYFGVYTVSNNFITNVSPNLSQSGFLGEIAVNKGTGVLLDKDGGILEEGKKVGTGTQFKHIEGQTEKIYTIVVYGDITGDGAVDLTDVLTLKAHLLNIQVLSTDSPFYKAANISEEDAISILDMISIRNYIIRKTPK